MMIHPAHRVTPSGRKLAERKTYRGLDVHIENKLGSHRTWQAPDGEQGSTLMMADYGYVPLTRGLDKDHLDVYVGPHANAEKVWVVKQLHPDTGAYDEDKCMLGFSDKESACAMYDAHYNRPGFRGEVAELSWGEFVAWCIDKGNWGRTVTPLEKALAIARINEKSGQTVEGQRRSSAKYAANPKNKRKRLAKWRIQSAKRSGEIKQPSKCQSCGKITHKLQLHHSHGYGSEASTRKGTWLCAACHTRKDPKKHGAAMARSQRNRGD